MEALLLVFPYYLVPAGLMVGVGIGTAVVLKRPHLFPYDYFAWVLPGLTYWVLVGPLDLEQAFRGKTLANLVEPILIGVISGLLFGLRVLMGVRSDRINKTASLWFVALSNVAAVAVFILMPSLPE